MERWTRALLGWAMLFIVDLATPSGLHAQAPNLPKSYPIPEQVQRELISLFQKYYPEATVTDRGQNGLLFEYAAKAVVDPDRDPNKAPPTREGPGQGGILCRVYCTQGRPWGQQSMIQICPGEPAQAFHRYPEYNAWSVFPYSKKMDAYISAGLAYPPDVNEDFLKRFFLIMVSFTIEK